MADTRDLPTATKPRRRRGPKDAQTAEPVALTASSKLEQIVALLCRPEGASLAELVALTGWQPHSVRGALAGSLKRKGHVILSEKIAGERRYRIEAGR
jgi:hypothetical protein